MGVLDLSGLSPKFGKSAATYSALLSQLQIQENQLAADGKLSPGDYDFLAKQAQSLYLHPGLTPSERDQVAVKISQYQKDKSTTALTSSEDIAALNRNNQDDFRKNTMLFANNPNALLQSNSAAMKLKLDQLSSSIDQIDQAGGDSSAHMNEYSKTLNEYSDLLDVMKEVEGNKDQSKPAPGAVAYITTNEKGEVNDIKIGRVGSQPGYVETNGVYGGLQVYGKVNSKQDGKNVFQLGSNRFSAPDLILPDPANPGAVKQGKLISEDMQSAQGGPGFNTTQDNSFKVISPATVRAQTAVAAGQWAQGARGTLYQAGDDGKYKKYINADPAKLGINPNNILKIPQSMEAGINSSVNKTIDAALPSYPSNFIGPVPNGAERSGAPLPAAPQAPTPPPGPAGTPRTPQPTSQAPSTGPQIAGEQGQQAKGFFSKLFG